MCSIRDTVCLHDPARRWGAGNFCITRDIVNLHDPARGTGPTRCSAHRDLGAPVADLVRFSEFGDRAVTPPWRYIAPAHMLALRGRQLCLHLGRPRSVARLAGRRGLGHAALDHLTPTRSSGAALGHKWAMAVCNCWVQRHPTEATLARVEHLAARAAGPATVANCVLCTPPGGCAPAPTHHLLAEPRASAISLAATGDRTSKQNR